MDDYFIANSNHFPALEEAGADLRTVLSAFGATLDEALRGYLMKQHGIAVETEPSTGANLALFNNQSRFDPAEGRLLLLDNAAQSTQRFQIARLAASLFAAGAIAAEIAGGAFSGEVPALRAERALASYTAGACLFPYEPFLRDAEAFGGVDVSMQNAGIITIRRVEDLSEAERAAMGEDDEPDREITVRDNFDVLPVRTPFSMASTPPLLSPDPTRYN